MKEAAGEANMTVVTIILIAAIVAIATPMIKGLMTQIGRKSCCVNAGGTLNGSTCSVADGWNESTKTCGTTTTP